jgi:hypothetical protein
MLPFARLARRASLAALSLAGLAGCGGAYLPGRTAGFDVDSATQIDDEDIRKAFEARPQLPSTLRVAYYTFDPLVAGDLDESLAALPGVTSVYRIPPLLVTGERRFEEGRSWSVPREVTLKKLRLLGARAHADALVVVDHGYRTGGVNAFAALNVLVVPMFFTPFVDTTVEGYAEAFLIDVRNGYLYGHVTEDDRRGARYATLYAKGAAELEKEQWKTLGVALQKDLASAIAAEHARPREGEAAQGARGARGARTAALPGHRAWAER